MEYLTRHLVAKKPMRHEGRELVAGDHFEASETDAGYYLRHGSADAHQPTGDTGSAKAAPHVAPAHTPPEDFDAKLGAVTSNSEPTNEGAATETSVESSSEELETQPAALSTVDSPVRPVTRRRGPSRA